MTFDPRTVPVGGTVRGAASGRRYVVIAPASPFRAYIEDIEGAHVGSLWFDNVRRDPGRHRAEGAPDQTTHRRWDAEHRKPGEPIEDPEVRAEWEQTRSAPLVAPPVTIVVGGPEAPYAGPWTLDGHGNVRVPISVALALRNDLERLTYARFLHRGPWTGGDEPPWEAWSDFVGNLVNLGPST